VLARPEVTEELPISYRIFIIRILPIVDWDFPIDKQSKRGKGLKRKEPGKGTESNRSSLFPSGQISHFKL
jgi:hypothetical protein